MVDGAERYPIYHRCHTLRFGVADDVSDASTSSGCLKRAHGATVPIGEEDISLNRAW